MINRFVEIIERIKTLKGLHTDSSVAAVLKLSKSNFSAYKQKGRIPYRALLRYAGEEEIALEYLLEGVLAAGTGAKDSQAVSENKYSVYDSRWSVDKLIEEVKKILAGENRAAAESLEVVIKFHSQSRENEKRLALLEEELQAAQLEILKAKQKGPGKK
jgi:hypothetical protein